MRAEESNFERSGKHRALLVDDNADVLDVVKATLERALPLRVDTAGSGAEALRMLSAAEYDIVLSDYHMPEMDGVSFLQKARERAPRTARVMITGVPDFDIAVAAINDGAITAFLPKPIDSKTLVEKVGKALDERHQAIVAARGHDQAARHFRRDIESGTGRDVGKPFTGALGASTRR